MKQRAFARTRCAAQREEFSASHVQTHAAQDIQSAPAKAVALVQIASFEQQRRRAGAGRNGRTS